jgi:uncharacterized membrane protein
MAVKKAEIDSDCSKKSSTGMDPKVAVLLAYLFGWIGGLVFWLIEKENKFVKWNALQSLILGILEVALILVVSVLLGLIPVIGWFFFSWLGWLLAGVCYVLAIVAIVMGFQCNTFRIPGVCKLTDKYFKM